MERYEELAERFAERQGKSARWVLVDRFDALIPALLGGEADIIATNLTITPERAEKVAFSAPLTTVSEWVVARSDAVEVDSLEALGGLRFGVPTHASYAQSLADYPALADVHVVSLPAGTLPDEVLETLVAGEIDATIMDDVIARTFVDMRDDVKQLFTLPTKRHLAWATRPTDMHLIHALDDFITESHVNAARRRLEVRDLKTIEDSGRIRMLTLDGPISYYLWRGELMGFDYELVKRFADSANLELEVVVAPSVSHLVPWLMEGRADLIAATLTITPEREKQGVAFTRPYLEVNEVIVSHVDAPPVASIDALKGRRVFVNPGTSHFTTANRLRDSVDLEVVSIDRPVEDLILAVAMGEIDLTIADDHVAEVESSFPGRLAYRSCGVGGPWTGLGGKKGAYGTAGGARHLHPPRVPRQTLWRLA
jgi:membrane-bound lytic murein transglycosylase F